MSTNIIGWVEIYDEGGRHKWRGAIKIDYLLRQDYMAFGYLFGVTHEAVTDPIAARRGLPGDVSREARYGLDLDGYLDHSWATWAEINASGWQNKKFTEDWWLLLEMVRLLAETYGDDGVRLVVAFV